jgi:hypothetical protein
MAGKIPTTKRIKLASNTEQWTLIENKLINELPCSAIVERNKDSTVKIQLVITSVVSPKNHRWQSTTEVSGGHSQQLNNGLERIKDFFSDLCNREIWILTGYIDGSNQVPILILYYELFKTSIYTIKFKKESYTDFLPEGILPPKD